MNAGARERSEDVAAPRAHAVAAGAPADPPAPAPAPARAAPIRSIRWIVAAAMVGLVAATVLAVGAFAERSARRAIELELREQLALQARNLAMVAAGALLSDVPEWTLLPLVQGIRHEHPDYAFVVVVDGAGAIVADTDARRLGTRYAPPDGLAPVAPEGSDPGGETMLAGRDLVVASTPVRSSDGQALGTVWLGLQRSAIARRLAAARREQLLVFGLFLLVGVAAALALSSMMLRPIGALRAGLERIGRGDLDTRLEVSDRTELGALAGTINRMADELRGAQAQQIERERMAHEVQLARRIQLSLLPSGRRVAGPFAIEGTQRAATEVGGDYFQILDLPGGRIGLVVADVSGKGLGGSLVTAMLHALLRPLAASHASPAALLEALDREIAAMLERGSFVTMFYGVLDPGRHELVFASAGHNPLLMVRRGGAVEWLRSPGAPLAALRGRNLRASYRETRVGFAPGDLALQYTDGITEAPGPDAPGLYGPDRMAAVAARLAASGGHALLEGLAREVTGWRAGAPQHDDETLLVIGRELDADAPAAGVPPGPAGAGDAMQAASALRHAMTRLREAQARGARLTLPASRAALVRIDDWIAARPELAALAPRAAGLLRLALHEACLNVVQHAYGDDGARTFDLWWVPAANGAHAETGDRDGSRPGRTMGYFLVRDRGRTFRYHEWTPPDPADAATRRRGHGFGIAIMRRAMDRIAYEADTPEGNLTCLVLGPGGAIVAEDTDDEPR